MTLGWIFGLFRGAKGRAGPRRGRTPLEGHGRRSCVNQISCWVLGFVAFILNFSTSLPLAFLCSVFLPLSPPADSYLGVPLGHGSESGAPC